MSRSSRFDPAERDDEVAEVRDAYRERPGISGQVEQALAERENAKAYGADTSGPDKRLRQLGHTRQKRTRPEAAEERRGAAEEKGGGEEQRREPPEGRSARPKDTAGTGAGDSSFGGEDGGSVAAKGGKQQAAGGSPPRTEPKGK
jgi:hypothetical protein